MDLDREEAQKLLSNVPERVAFRCRDGRMIRNIRELGKTLAHMPDDSFHYHANPDKNDFSRWVRETVGDEKLAGNLNRATNRRQALKEIFSRITFLSGRLS